MLYAFVIVRLGRRDLIWINVATNPTAEWIARQLTEAFPWDEAPQYLIRDRDRIYGATRFIPDGLLGLFERTAWPIMTSGSDSVRARRQGAQIDIRARMRGMWQ